jgi:hypothetical protein
MSFVGGAEAVYSFLLRLFPPPFQKEYGDEMRDVFHAFVAESARLGRASLLRTCLFELLDLPICLVFEHVSQLRKECSMKDLRHGVRAFRTAELGALAFLVGGVLRMLARKFLVPPDTWYNYRLVNLLMEARQFVFYLLAVILLAGVIVWAAGVNRRVTRRAIGFTLIAATAVYLASYAIYTFTPLYSWIISLGGGQYQSYAVFFTSFPFDLLAGLLIGGALGVASGNWQTCRRFLLFSMSAFGAASLVNAFIYVGLYNWSWSTGYPMTAIGFVDIVSSSAYYILSGGILGWFYGKEISGRVGPEFSVTAATAA